MAFKERVFPACSRPAICTSAIISARITKFVALQDSYDCIYCVVDLHAHHGVAGSAGARSAPSAR